jgi:hypothetical protein
MSSIYTQTPKRYDSARSDVNIRLDRPYIIYDHDIVSGVHTEITPIKLSGSLFNYLRNKNKLNIINRKDEIYINIDDYNAITASDTQYDGLSYKIMYVQYNKFLNEALFKINDKIDNIEYRVNLLHEEFIKKNHNNELITINLNVSYYNNIIDLLGLYFKYGSYLSNDINEDVHRVRVIMRDDVIEEDVILYESLIHSPDYDSIYGITQDYIYIRDDIIIHESIINDYVIFGYKFIGDNITELHYGSNGSHKLNETDMMYNNKELLIELYNALNKHNRINNEDELYKMLRGKDETDPFYIELNRACMDEAIINKIFEQPMINYRYNYTIFKRDKNINKIFLAYRNIFDMTGEDLPIINELHMVIKQNASIHLGINVNVDNDIRCMINLQRYCHFEVTYCNSFSTIPSFFYQQFNLIMIEQLIHNLTIDYDFWSKIPYNFYISGKHTIEFRNFGYKNADDNYIYKTQCKNIKTNMIHDDEYINKINGTLLNGEIILFIPDNTNAYNIFLKYNTQYYYIRLESCLYNSQEDESIKFKQDHYIKKCIYNQMSYTHKYGLCQLDHYIFNVTQCIHINTYDFNPSKLQGDGNLNQISFLYLPSQKFSINKNVLNLNNLCINEGKNCISNPHNIISNAIKNIIYIYYFSNINKDIIDDSIERNINKATRNRIFISPDIYKNINRNLVDNNNITIDAGNYMNTGIIRIESSNYVGFFYEDQLGNYDDKLHNSQIRTDMIIDVTKKHLQYYIVWIITKNFEDRVITYLDNVDNKYILFTREFANFHSNELIRDIKDITIHNAIEIENIHICIKKYILNNMPLIQHAHLFTGQNTSLHFKYHYQTNLALYESFRFANKFSYMIYNVDNVLAISKIIEKYTDNTYGYQDYISDAFVDMYNNNIQDNTSINQLGGTVKKRQNKFLSVSDLNIKKYALYEYYAYKPVMSIITLCYYANTLQNILSQSEYSDILPDVYKTKLQKIYNSTDIMFPIGSLHELQRGSNALHTNDLLITSSIGTIKYILNSTTNHRSKLDICIYKVPRYNDVIANAYEYVSTNDTVRNLYGNYKSFDYLHTLNTNMYNTINCANSMYNVHECYPIAMYLSFPVYYNNLIYALNHLNNNGILLIGLFMASCYPAYEKFIQILCYCFEKVDTVVDPIKYKNIQCTCYNFNKKIFDKLKLAYIDMTNKLEGGTITYDYNNESVYDALQKVINSSILSEIYFYKEHTNKEHTNKEHTNKEHTNKEHTNKEHTNKEHTNKEHTNKEHTNKVSKKINNKLHVNDKLHVLYDLNIEIKLNKKQCILAQTIIKQFNTYYDSFYDDLAIKLYRYLPLNEHNIETIVNEIIYKDIATYIKFLKEHNYPHHKYFTHVLDEYDKNLISDIYSFPPEFSYHISKYDYKYYPIYDQSDVYTYDTINKLTDELYAVKQARENLQKTYGRVDIDEYKEIVSNDFTRGITQYIKKTYAINASNGFAKLYEIYKMFPQLLYNSFKKNHEKNHEKNHNFKVFHMCECPGGWIHCTQHIKNNKHGDRFNNDRDSYTWYANSLNPLHQDNKKYVVNNTEIIGIKDEYGYLKNYKDRWLFGADNTGDITNSTNIRWFIEQKKDKLMDVNLILGDGGLPTESDLILLEKLDYSQMLLTLAVASSDKKSKCVIKTFSPFFFQRNEENNNMVGFFINLLYTYNQHFEELHICKPLSSSSQGGELYIIGINFNGISDDVLNTLIKIQENFTLHKTWYKKNDIPEHFILQIKMLLYNLSEMNIKAYDKLEYYTLCKYDTDEEYRAKHNCNELLNSRAERNDVRFKQWIKLFNFK